MKPFANSSAPSWVVLQLNEQCNLRCRMCYQWGEGGAYLTPAPRAMLEPELAFQVVRDCLPFKPAFEFFGGEPLLYPQLHELTAMVRAGGCELSFPTNGTLLEEHAERLVACGPTRLFVSLDGPKEINDAQRGNGVFNRVTRGLARLKAEKQKRDSMFPRLGVTCVVTPLNHRHLTRLFLEELDLETLSFVSLELQSFTTDAQYQEYARLLREQFGIPTASCARAYVRDPAEFQAIDFDVLSAQLQEVRDACRKRGITFFSQPRFVDADNLRAYFDPQRKGLADLKSRCAVPWKCAEISARGEVTTCHTFNDLSVGDLHQQSLLEIWRGERLAKMRDHLRNELFPICTACCRYYIGPSSEVRT